MDCFVTCRRTVVSIPNGPSALAVKEAAWGLARYAAISQVFIHTNLFWLDLDCSLISKCFFLAHLYWPLSSFIKGVLSVEGTEHWFWVCFGVYDKRKRDFKHVLSHAWVVWNLLFRFWWKLLFFYTLKILLWLHMRTLQNLNCWESPDCAKFQIAKILGYCLIFHTPKC